MSQPTSNSGNPPRRPINAGDDTTIFTAQPNTTINNNNNSNNTNNSNAYTSNNTTYNPKANNHQTNPHTSRQLNNNTNGSGTQRQISPTRSSENGGPKILKRELWWKETPASQVKILTNGKPSVNNVTAKVDHRNSGYNPNRSNGKQIESRKLEWNTRSGKNVYFIGNWTKMLKKSNRV